MTPERERRADPSDKRSLKKSNDTSGYKRRERSPSFDKRNKKSAYREKEYQKKGRGRKEWSTSRSPSHQRGGKKSGMKN
jgi:hypothetical protein